MLDLRYVCHKEIREAAADGFALVLHELRLNALQGFSKTHV